MITTVMLTAYLTVYDGLSPWYRAAVRVQKPRRNELSLGLQTSLDGFRDQVSQVLRLLVWFADYGLVIYQILSVDLDSASEEPAAEVSLRLTYEDGSSSTRITYFVYESREWKHRFSDEEHDLFMPEASYEEFVEAQQ